MPLAPVKSATTPIPVQLSEPEFTAFIFPHLSLPKRGPKCKLGCTRVLAIFGVQSWRWDWVREVRELVFALDADAAGQQQWRALARQAALRGKRVAVLPPAAYGGCKDVSEAWVAGSLAVGAWSTPAATAGSRPTVPADLHEVWAERVAIMLADGHLLPADAERLAWEGLQGYPQSSMASHAGHDGKNA